MIDAMWQYVKQGLGALLPEWLVPDILTPPKVDPLVIDLNGNGQVDLISVGDSRVNMDLDANGYAERIAWVAPSDGLLAMDRNGNGKIDGLADLFGTATTDGFIVLKTLDSNNDNKMTAADAQFGKLRVWQDLNGDGIAQSTEVKTLAQHGITEISLNRTTVNQFIDGTRIAEKSAVTTTTGSKSISSVYFARETLLSEWQAPAGFTVSAAAAKLPGLKGYGEVKDLDAAMTLNGTLLTQVQTLVTSSTGMTGAQIKGTFEAILYKWTGAEAVAAGSRGAYIDAKHLTVIEKFYGTQFTQMIGTTAEHNPNAWQAPELEKLYANMLGSMLLQFTGQIAISQSILANNPEAMTSSPFWPLALLSEGTEAGMVAALDLISKNAPVDGSKDAYFEKLYTVLARGAAVNLYDGDLAAAKAGFATLTDAVTAHWLGAYLDGYVTTLGTSAGTTMTGTTGKDLLAGLAGNDVLVGDHGDDILIGGTGNDTLQGGGGNDRYYYRIGDGADLISETGYNMGDDDRVYFGKGLTTANTRVAFVDLNMVLTFTGVTGSLTVERQDAGGWRGMEAFVFGDGTVKTSLELMQMGIEQQEASGAAVITGTTWNNVFRGNNANNTLNGYAGDDTYYYNIGGGNDIISDIGNGTGEDRLYLGAGLSRSAMKVAFTGIDMTLTFTGVTGSITLREAGGFNGSGVEWVHFNDGTVWDMGPFMSLYIQQQEASGAAVIHGTGWDNVLRGNSANNTLKGYAGNDTYYYNVGGGNDIIDEGDLNAGEADKLILGTGLNPTNLQIARGGSSLTLSFTGQAGSVQLYREDDVANRGVEIITFGNGVTWGRAELYQAYITQEQNKGAATLMGFGLTNDTITGSAIANTIYGYGGNDTLYGMNGNDTLYGGVSFDTLFGGAGNDTLFGEADSDILNGGAGNDTLLGGAANDFFVFTAGANGTDTITDFENGIDRIDLRGMGLTYAGLTITQMGTGVKIIKTGSTDLDVTLANFSLANVDTSDFLFT